LGKVARDKEGGMLTYEKIKGKASIFKSLTGLSLAALGQIAARV
jgi:hypothetical protein